VDAASRFQSFDLLATLVAVVRSNASVIFSNAAGRRVGYFTAHHCGFVFHDAFTEPVLLRSALERVPRTNLPSLRYDALLKRMGHEPCPCM
jgi:two-component system nitrogen regulation sensor histidine kinase GlnL